MKFRRIDNLYFLLVFIAMSILSCDTSNNVDPIDQNYFLKYYGEDGNQEAIDMIVNPDGTFILLGKSETSAQTILLIKADTEGKIIWQKKLGTGTDDPKDIEPTLDGKYVILSDFQKAIGNADIKIIRIDAEGNKIDSVTQGTASNHNETSHAITPLADGGFIVTGTTSFDWKSADDVDRNSSILHFRFNNDFSSYNAGQWEDHYGSGKNNVGIKVIQNGDKLYLFGHSDDNENKKMMIIYYSLNEFGSSRVPGYLGDASEDTDLTFATKSPLDLIDGYLLVGTANGSSVSPKARVSKVKNPLFFNVNSDRQFDLNIAGARRLAGVYGAPSISTPIGYFIVSNESTETSGTDIVLSKIDQSGSEIWSVNFGAEKNDQAAAVAELPDGKIVVLCTIESALQSKIALMKLNSKGQLLN
jgi:hypothetical protein